MFPCPVYPPTGQQQPYQQRPTYQDPPHRESRYAEHAYAEQAYAEPAYRTGGGAKRVVRTVLVTILLVLVPVVCGYVAYRFASGEWSLP